MNKFANSQKAAALCDVCGQRFKLSTLKPLIVKGKNTNILACKSCYDVDHPQLRQGEKPINDPQALRNPRPDTGKLDSQRIAGNWNPIGGGNSLSGTPNHLVSTCSLGSITVTTS